MTDERFKIAITQTLAHEGGFVDDPTDSGGATNWGISLRFLRKVAGGDIDMDGDIDADDIREITREQATELYYKHFWKKYHCDALPEPLAIKFFDLCVNMGPGQATRLLQEALNCCRYKVVVDGIMGQDTISIANLVTTPEAVVSALRARALGFYRELMAKKPELNKYRKGWERRALS